MKKKLILALIMLIGFTNLGFAQKGISNPEDSINSRILVLFYSQTGSTKKIAEEFQSFLNADIDSIVPLVSYGYDYDATIARWRKEKENNEKPEIKPLTKNIDDYDIIFLGFPIWGGTFASPVETWLENTNLSAKTIVPFATFGSGGIEKAGMDIYLRQPGSEILPGYGIRSERLDNAPSEIERFLAENGFIENNMQSLPEFSQEAPVNEKEIEIFNEACGNYKFPLGTPLTVAKRSYSGTDEYEYFVKSKTPDGKDSEAIIYVIVEQGKKPEFTKVIR